MNWRSLVAREYASQPAPLWSYLLAATLAVTVFAMFTDFVDNPAVKQSHISQYCQ